MAAMPYLAPVIRRPHIAVAGDPAHHHHGHRRPCGREERRAARARDRPTSRTAAAARCFIRPV